MSRMLGSWRASYTPGSWLVLCGPTTAVVLEPADASWTDLVETLWTEVVAARSIGELAERLAAYRIDTMPSFAAFFWGADGMRSLVRGDVRVLDSDTAEVVAHGSGVQTWTETGLGGLLRVEVNLPGEHDPSAPALPLVVGVVGASSLLLDASDGARLASPQGDGPIAPDAEDTGTADTAAEQGGVEVPAPAEELATELVDPFEDDRVEHRNAATRFLPLPDDLAAAASVPSPPVDDQSTPSAGTGPTVDAVLCPWNHPNPPGASRCRVCTAPIERQQARPVPPPVLAVLRASNGEVIAMDRPVLVGRAPSAGRSQVRDPELLVLSSPSHDISRTHLEIVPADWQLTLTDLHSTNGTIVTNPDGSTRQLNAGEPVAVELGSAVELADGVSVLIDFPQ